MVHLSFRGADRQLYLVTVIAVLVGRRISAESSRQAPSARNRLLERHGHHLVTLDSPRRRAVQVVLGAPMTSSGGRVIM